MLMPLLDALKVSPHVLNWLNSCITRMVVEHLLTDVFLLFLDKQKENEKLRETLARRTAKLEQSRKECDALRQENFHLQETLKHSSQENALLQDSLRSSKEELHRYIQAQVYTWIIITGRALLKVSSQDTLPVIAALLHAT